MPDLAVGQLVWAQFGPNSDAFLGRIEKRDRRFTQQGEWYVFFITWKDPQPHGGRLISGEFLHPIEGLT